MLSRRSPSQPKNSRRSRLPSYSRNVRYRLRKYSMCLIFTFSFFGEFQWITCEHTDSTVTPQEQCTKPCNESVCKIPARHHIYQQKLSGYHNISQTIKLAKTDTQHEAWTTYDSVNNNQQNPVDLKSRLF